MPAKHACHISAHAACVFRATGALHCVETKVVASQQALARALPTIVWACHMLHVQSEAHASQISHGTVARVAGNH